MAAAGTLSIKDNGIGMSEAEVIDNLGTIARSGTRKFLETLSGDSAKDAQLIGQFGVGFYSAFIVADKVTVLSKRTDAPAVRWDSDGEGQYQIQADEKADRGTEVILHLRDEDKEFLEPERLRQLVRKYSDHLSLPIMLKTADAEETVNQAKAFWTRPKSELKDEDYQAFYKHIAHDSEDARVWAHNKVEGSIEYTSLLYLPKRAPFDLFEREQKGGIQLYVKRVFIMDRAAELLRRICASCAVWWTPPDLPLNVSRELLQNNRTVEKIKSALVKRSVDLLEDLAANKPEEYAEFWKTFGVVLKEGIIEDPSQKERIAKLLRFHSSTAAGDVPGVTLEQYAARMQSDQKAIYYLTADSLGAARNSPHLEAFRAKGVEVLLLIDRIDEWVAGHLHEFAGKPLANVASSAADVESAIETPDKAAAESTFKATTERLGKGSDGQDRQRASVRAVDRFAGRIGRRGVRREPAHGPHSQAGGTEQSLRHAADSRVESKAPADRTAQGYPPMRLRSPTLRTCSTIRRCWRRAASSMIRRSSFAASTGSSWKGWADQPKNYSELSMLTPQVGCHQRYGRGTFRTG